MVSGPWLEFKLLRRKTYRTLLPRTGRYGPMCLAGPGESRYSTAGQPRGAKTPSDPPAPREEPMISTANRRQFLGSAAAAAAFSIVPRHVFGGPAYVAPSDKINLAYVCATTPGLGP